MLPYHWGQVEKKLDVAEFGHVGSMSSHWHDKKVSGWAPEIVKIEM